MSGESPCPWCLLRDQHIADLEMRVEELASQLSKTSGYPSEPSLKDASKLDRKLKAASRSGPFKFGCNEIEIDLERHEVWIKGELVIPPLTSLEFRILKVLHDHCATVVRRDTLWTEAWGSHYYRDVTGEQYHSYDRATVNKAVERLRKRLEEVLQISEPIRTIRSVGYILDASPLPITPIGQGKARRIPFFSRKNQERTVK